MNCAFDIAASVLHNAILQDVTPSIVPVPVKCSVNTAVTEFDIAPIALRRAELVRCKGNWITGCATRDELTIHLELFFAIKFYRYSRLDSQCHAWPDLNARYDNIGTICQSPGGVGDDGAAHGSVRLDGGRSYR